MVARVDFNENKMANAVILNLTVFVCHIGMQECYANFFIL